jgi:hypothetical protein
MPDVAALIQPAIFARANALVEQFVPHAAMKAEIERKKLPYETGANCFRDGVNAIQRAQFEASGIQVRLDCL